MVGQPTALEGKIDNPYYPTVRLAKRRSRIASTIFTRHGLTLTVDQPALVDGRRRCRWLETPSGALARKIVPTSAGRRRARTVARAGSEALADQGQQARVARRHAPGPRSKKGVLGYSWGASDLAIASEAPVGVHSGSIAANLASSTRDVPSAARGLAADGLPDKREMVRGIRRRLGRRSLSATV
jgi:hypothetical protein